MTELNYRFKLDTAPAGIDAKEGDILKVDSIKFSGGAQISYDNFLVCCTASMHYEPFEKELEETKAELARLKAKMKNEKDNPTRKATKHLSPSEQLVVDKKILKGIANVTIARKHGISPSAVSRRKKYLEKSVEGIPTAAEDYADSLKD